jgi:hypothetical protein
MERMVTGADKRLKGRVVRFLVKHVYLPEPASILHELHDAEELSGKVVDLSDSAYVEGSPFVVVQVRGLRRPCVVSVDRLLRSRKRSPVGP